jgi:hypothetical protein
VALKQLSRIVLTVAAAASLALVDASSAETVPCGESSVRGNLEGEGDRVRLSLGGYSSNCVKSLGAKPTLPSRTQLMRSPALLTGEPLLRAFVRPLPVRTSVISLLLRPLTSQMARHSQPGFNASVYLGLWPSQG